MEERPDLTLTACDGALGAHLLDGDDLHGMLALALECHERGFAVWLRDRVTGELVAASSAACYGCERESECGDHLDVGTEAASAAFWSRLLKRPSLLAEIRRRMRVGARPV